MCGQAVGGVSQVINGVLEGEWLQAALLTVRRLQRTPRLRRALRLPISERRSGLGDHGIGVGIAEWRRGESNRGLGACPAEARRGLVVRRHIGERALGVLQVHQRDAAATGRQVVSLILV